LGLEFLTPVGVAFGRTFLGALALVTISLVKKIALPKDRRIWAHLWVVSMLLNVVPGVLFAVAETKVTSILAPTPFLQSSPCLQQFLATGSPFHILEGTSCLIS